MLIFSLTLALMSSAQTPSSKSPTKNSNGVRKTKAILEEMEADKAELPPSTSNEEATLPSPRPSLPSEEATLPIQKPARAKKAVRPSSIRREDVQEIREVEAGMIPPGDEPIPNEVPCDTCGKFMREGQARAMYRDFSLEQFPRRAVFAFGEWVVPPGSRCTNSRELGKGDFKKTCTVCSDKVDAEERALHEYALKDFAADDKNVTAKFEGQTGPFELKCSPKGAWSSPIELVEDLSRLGVDVRFRYPKAAELSPAQMPAGAPSSAK